MIGVIGIYIFIVLGFLAKKQFKIDGKTLVILSTYYLQPFLTLWGILLMPLNKDLKKLSFYINSNLVRCFSIDAKSLNIRLK